MLVDGQIHHTLMRLVLIPGEPAAKRRGGSALYRAGSGDIWLRHRRVMKAMILDLRKVPLDRLADPLTQMQEPGYAGLATSAALSSGPVTSSPGPGWPIDLMVAFATAASHQTTQELPDPDQGSPLRLLAQRGVWRLFGGTAWSFGLPIRITNITEEPIPSRTTAS